MEAAEFARVHEQLQQAYQQVDRDLDFCRRIQRSLLPRTLPDLPPARFAVHYRPCGRAGGDSYHVCRLDEDHVGFYLADVIGHGLPASLLTIFLKEAIRLKEIAGREYRILAPHEVLQRLNRDLLDQAVADNPFITMVYAVFDRRDRSVSFARAGHPQPIYVPRRRAPKIWQSEGTLLGVFETHFATQIAHLQFGDKLLFHSDGLDSLAAADKPLTTDRLLELAAHHGRLPLQEFVNRISRDLLEETAQPDDFTLLGLEIRD